MILYRLDHLVEDILRCTGRNQSLHFGASCMKAMFTLSELLQTHRPVSKCSDEHSPSELQSSHMEFL